MSGSKHQFYRSLSNGVIYPAMQSIGEGPDGRSIYYQDEHPTEWQPVSETEYSEQNRREALLARRNDVIDLTPTTVETVPAPPAPPSGLVPPPPAGEIEA